jgi:hypothetical protein
MLTVMLPHCHAATGDAAVGAGRTAMAAMKMATQIAATGITWPTVFILVASRCAGVAKATGCAGTRWGKLRLRHCRADQQDRDNPSCELHFNLHCCAVLSWFLDRRWIFLSEKK